MYTVFIWAAIYRIKLFWQLSTDFRFPVCLTLTANDPEVALKMASVYSSKSDRLADFLPSIRPSFLSLVVLFACRCLWMKNETTNERLTALESRINMSPVEVFVKTGCSAMENSDRSALNPKEQSAKNLLKKLRRPVDEVKLKDTSGILSDTSDTF